MIVIIKVFGRRFISTLGVSGVKRIERELSNVFVRNVDAEKRGNLLKFIV